MGWLEDKLTKWVALIERYATEEGAKAVAAGSERLNDATPEERGAWTCGAMERLAGVAPDDETRARIMTERSCVFPDEFGAAPLEGLRALYRSTADVDAVLGAMAKDAARHGSSRRDGGLIYETKAPADAGAWRAAQTPYERRRAACYCPLARAATTPVPQPYCFCGGGWYKGIWEFILDRPVRVEVAASVMQGDDACVFRVYLPRENIPDGARVGSKPRSRASGSI